MPASVPSSDAMTAAIQAAKKSVHVEFYILLLDDTTAPFFDALEAGAKSCITVGVSSEKTKPCKRRKTSSKSQLFGYVSMLRQNSTMNLAY